MRRGKGVAQLLLFGLALALASLYASSSPARAAPDMVPLRMVPRGAAPAVSTGDERVDAPELYRLYCSTCHGDQGQGLTEEWRTRNFPDGDQNCWKSRCHALNHDPGGFVFPKQVPAIIGTGTLASFPTAATLFEYIRAAMPYYAPGLLEEDEYLALAHYLTEQNYLARGMELPLPLDSSAAEMLARVPLHRGVRGLHLAAAAPRAAPAPIKWLPGVLLLASAVGGMWRRQGGGGTDDDRRRPTSKE